MTDNELIAEFMGIEVVQYVTHFGTVLAIVPEEGIIDWPELRTFNPDTDWNQLMDVLRKIYEWSLDRPDSGYLVDDYRHLCDLSIMVNKEVVYNRATDFIKWYNENKTK